MIVGDPPEPSPSPRVYNRGWEPAYWRGSLVEIVGAGQAALDEIKRQHPSDDISETVHLEFADKSKQDFGSLSGLQGDLSTIDIGEVTGVRLGFSPASDTTAGARIRASPFGLSVTAEGSEAFASGMVATLKSRLAGGAEAGEQAASVPLRLIDWILLALIPIVFIGSQFFLDAQFAREDRVGHIILGLTFAGVPGLIALFVVGEGRDDLKPPPFVIVAEGDQFPDEGEARTGPIWTAKAWLEKHPAVALGLVLVIGALLGRAADLIEF